jgi:hypothetical protein
LGVVAYGKLYIWRAADVQISYNNAVVPLSEIPSTTNRKMDVLVARAFRAINNAKRAGTDPKSVANPSPDCADCLLIFESKLPGSPPPTPVVIDSWQRQPDYSAWNDPALQNQVTPTEPPVPQSAPKASSQDRSLMLVHGGGGNQGGGGASPVSWSGLQWSSGYTFSGGGGGGSASLFGTDVGCELLASNCVMKPGDDENDIYYFTGDGGAFTAYPNACQPVEDGYVVSTTDNLPCTPFQDIFYIGDYTGNNQNAPTSSILPDSQVTISIDSAGSIGDVQALNGAHLYLTYWQKLPAGQPCPVYTPNPLMCPQADTILQAGKVAGRVGPVPFPQNPGIDNFLVITPNLFSLWNTLSQNAITYDQNYTNWPTYAPLTMNSNSWVDGILLSVPKSQSTINLYVSGLESPGLIPYAYQNGGSAITLSSGNQIYFYTLFETNYTGY